MSKGAKMELSPRNPEVAFSHWRVEEDLSDYLCRERDASACFSPTENNEYDLRDPPLVYAETINEATGNVMYDQKYNAQNESLMTSSNTECDKSVLKRIENQTRQAPSKMKLDMLVNTVEIVKKDGMYSMVFDGVSQNAVAPSRNFSQSDTVRYWMPRFKETSFQGPKRMERSVAPVMFSMRVEDGEELPKKCEIRVCQRVVDKGYVVMNDEIIDSHKIPINQTSKSEAEATLLSYPIVSTPPPYIGVNDYSKMEEYETLMALHNIGILKELYNLGETIMTRGPWRVFSNYDSLKKSFSTIVYTIVNNYKSNLAVLGALAGVWYMNGLGVVFSIANFAASAVVDYGVALAESGKDTASATLSAATSGASAVASGVSVASRNRDAIRAADQGKIGEWMTALLGIGGGLVSVAASSVGSLFYTASATAELQVFSSLLYPAIQVYMAVSSVGAWALDKKEYTKIVSLHRQACTEKPTVHQITLDELPGVIYRIAETRANGSMLDGTDETVGRSYLDLEAQGWKRESAFMKWLQYGDGQRKHRKTLLRNKNDVPDPVTGRYSTEQNLELNNALSNEGIFSSAPGITRNTIDKTGLHISTVVNTRTEFFFEVLVIENDGTSTTCFRIDPTRTNGVDAAWLSSGYHEKIIECEDAIKCLELRLSTMPGVGANFLNSGRVVGDTTNGTFVGNGFNVEKSAAFGRTPGLKQPPKNETLRKEAAESDFQKASKTAKDKGDALAKKMDSYTKNGNSIVKRSENLRKSVARSITNPGKTPVATRLKLYKKYREFMDKKMTQRLKIRKDIDEASEEKMNADRELEIYRARRNVTADQTRPANLWNFDDTMKRLRGCVMGTEYCDSDDELEDFEDTEEGKKATKTNKVKADEAFRKRERAAVERTSIWRRILVGNSTEMKALRFARAHTDYCKEALCDSLGIYSDQITDDNPMVVRFVDMFSPFPNYRNTALLRFNAFKVPYESMWIGIYSIPQVVRTLPQFVSIQSGLVSSFGKVTTFSPKSIESRSSLFDYNVAKSSVKEASDALKRSTKHMDVSSMRFGPQGMHFLQAYYGMDGWRKNEPFLGEKLSIVYGTVDLLASSCTPSTALIDHKDICVSAGSRILQAQISVAAGKDSYGTSKLLRDMNLEVSIESMLAVSVFSEILSFEIIARGVPSRSNMALEMSELLSSCINRARQYSVIVAQFAIDFVVRKKQSVSRILENDISFFALPGMAYFRILMRTLGAFSGVQPNGSLAAVSLERCNTVSRSLIRIASSQKLPISRFPFTCIQSCIAYVPPAINRMLPDETYGNAIALSIEQYALSFERMSIATGTLPVRIYTPMIVCLMVDIVCTRPIVVKAIQYDSALTSSFMGKSTAMIRQRDWMPKVPCVPSAMLLRRLMTLRIDINSKNLVHNAIPEAENGIDNIEQNVHDRLVKSMMEMTVRGTHRLHPKRNAEFMIPFGCLAEGSPSDVPHYGFEMHPVWLEYLVIAIDQCIDDISSNLKTVNSLKAVDDKHNNIPFHPYQIFVEGSTVVAFMHSLKSVLYDEHDIFLDLLDYTGSFYVNTDFDVISLPSKVADDLMYRACSGKMRSQYKMFMHNAERIMQVNMIGASGFYVPANDDRKLHFLRRGGESLSQLSLYIAVGNAMSAVTSGSSFRTAPYTSFSGNGSLTQVAIKSSADSLVRLQHMCKQLILGGVKAVPFSEMCMLCVVVG
jgi:hypothetical protein